MYILNTFHTYTHFHTYTLANPQPSLSEAVVTCGRHCATPQGPNLSKNYPVVIRRKELTKIGGKKNAGAKLKS
jgi:hypothetical protein